MKYKSALIAVLILLFAFFQLNAHEDHDKKKEKPDTVTVVNGDTIAINGVAQNDSILTSNEVEVLEEESTQPEEFKMNAGDALFEHIHNKIIHYPIALVLVAFLFAVLSYKDDRYQLVIKIMLLIAGVFAIIAYFSGTNQFDHFIDNPKEWLAETHRLLGIASAIFIWLWYLALIFKPMKKFNLIFAVITLIIVSLTGLYGGVLAH